MKNKRLTILSPFFFPEPISTGKFNTDLALKLKEKGFDVSVICFHPLYPEWKSKKTQQQLEGINIIRGGSNINYGNSQIKRRLILEVWFSFLVLRNLKLIKSSDYIIPIFPPSFAFFVASFFISKAKKVVGIVHDLQLVFINQKKGWFFRAIKQLILPIEKRCFKKCDTVIFLSKEMKDTADEMYKLDNAKLKVQYPFITLQNQNLTNQLDHIFDEHKKNIVYSGALGEKQNPRQLLKLFDKYANENSQTRFYFFSRGYEFEELKKINTNPNIKFYDLVNQANLLELYRKSTVQIIPQKEGTSKGSLPSKLPNILFSGTKVLVITDKESDLEELFKKQQLEKVINSWDYDVFSKSLSELLNQKNDIKRQLEISKELFSIEVLLDNIVH